MCRSNAHKIIGPLDIKDMRYALEEAFLEDMSAIPGHELPVNRRPQLSDFDVIVFYYRTEEPTNVDIRWVAEDYKGQGYWYVAAGLRRSMTWCVSALKRRIGSVGSFG